jgi:2-(1,2-epoxy-1,2-dihydrophenyl)acetyl-CoA isomerase
MQPADDLVQLSHDAVRGIATLTFNRPHVFNALDVAMAMAFEHRCAEISALNGLRCVVLTGAGKAFVAGGDVGAFAADPDAADRTLGLILNHMHPALLTLRRLDAPVVAAVNGTAAGAGLSLVLGADYVVANRVARLVMAYDRLGVPPDCGGTWFLTRKLGRARAFDMMLMGTVLTADDALAQGLVNVVADPAEFEAVVQHAAEKIASGPTLAFGRFKRLMDADVPLETQLEREREAFAASTRTEDFRNAARAFVTKQAPSFKGR